MAIRMTDMMRFTIAADNISSLQDGYADIMEKMATQKRINRPSDDPTGITRCLDLKQTKSSVDQYLRNIDNCNSWLPETEAKLTASSDLLSKAREVAVSQSSATASMDTRRTAAQNVQQIMEELLSLANGKLGDRYLFAGSRTDVDPFSATFQGAQIETPAGANANSYDGTVSASGSFTGSTNKNYVVKIVTGGAADVATYTVSTDGGRTWGAVQSGIDSGPISLGDGVSLTFAGGSQPFGTGDIFSTRALAPGYYRGDAEALSLPIGQGSVLQYSISGSSVFTGGGGNVDVFQTLSDLKDALEQDDADTVREQIDKLKSAADQVIAGSAKCGTMTTRLDTAKNNLNDLSGNITQLISSEEDADVTKLATQLASKELSLQASYAVAARIGNTSILDFIK